MFVLLLVVVGVLVFVVAAVAAGAGTPMAAAHPDRPGPCLPVERPVAGPDVDRVRFSVGLRGYRMDEVDDVLDRLSVELAGRDARIGELERELSTLAGAPPAEPPAADPSVADSPVADSPVAEPEQSAAAQPEPAGAAEQAETAETPDVASPETPEAPSPAAAPAAPAAPATPDTPEVASETSGQSERAKP